jgi:hypothetical protein
MDGSERLQMRHGVVVWEKRGVSCTCLTHTCDHIEICLVVNDGMVDRQQFADADAASRYAIEKMPVQRELTPLPGDQGF